MKSSLKSLFLFSGVSGLGGGVGALEVRPLPTLGVRLAGLGLAGLRLEIAALDDIVGDNDEEGAKLSEQLLADLLADDRVLLGVEVGGQTLDRINEIESLDSAIRG